MTTETLGRVVHSYFLDYLISQRGLRPATIRSYRDVLRLFLAFVAENGRHKVSKLEPTDLGFQQVQDFLCHLEEKRGNSIRTRNHRLTVLRSFFEYLARMAPEALSTSQRVGIIPAKRTSPPETHYLESEDVAILFRSLPAVGRHAPRDRALLLFLYNTGARVQEAADVRVSHLDLGPHPRVQLHGKGDRWRTCPLWATTAEELQSILDHRTPLPSDDAPIFTTSSGRALTRFGIYKIVRRHATRFENARGKPIGFSIGPHTFRHTAAVHLLESGTDVNVIRGWLGHVSLDSTHRYAEINAKLKEAALNACEPPIGPSDEHLRRAVWKNDEELLKWLNSL
jgi:site-specific recombinase XerD